MILRDSEARNQWRWAPHFLPHEFADHENGEIVVETVFMDRLVLLRDAYRKPMRITSGYRTPAHNHRVSTTGFAGPHTTGCAADLLCFGAEALQIVGLARALNFTGIGVSQKGPEDARFIHLDILTAPDFPRPTIWSY